MDGGDWCLVNAKKKKKKKKTTTPQNQQSRVVVVVKPEQQGVKKFETDSKKKPRGTKQQLKQNFYAQLAEETQELKHTGMPFGLGIIIQQARQAKGYSQKEFATKICEKSQVIQDYEAGRGILDDLIIEKMEKVLSVKLTGTERGQPIESKKFKRAST